MTFKRVLREATRIISVNIEKGTDQNPNPKVGLGDRGTVDLDKKKLRVVPKILDKEMKHMEYYIPDLPEGAWESIPAELKKFYKDFMNSYPEVTFQPPAEMAKYNSMVKKLMKKYPQIKWKKVLPNQKQVGHKIGSR